MANARGLKVVCFSFYPAAGPSVRHRISTYRADWDKAGASLELKAFLTCGLYRRRRNFGLLAGAYKLLAFAYCTVRLLLRILTVRDYDIVIIHREAFPLGSAFFEKLIASLNAHTVFDLDDATWTRMPLKVDQRRFLFDPDKVGDAMAACRAVVVGNAYLARYAERHCKDVVIIPTPYHDLGGQAATDRARPTIVWIGNVGNEAYLQMLSVPLARLARHHDFVFRIIGSEAVLGWEIPGVQVEALAWREDREKEWLLDSAIGVMPLLDRDYERGKCAFKLIQYFSAGLPVVASPVGMNTGVVRAGENGFLANSEEEWYQALAALLDDSRLRQRMGACGYSLYRAEFTPAVNAGTWLALMDRIGGAAENQRRAL